MAMILSTTILSNELCRQSTSKRLRNHVHQGRLLQSSYQFSRSQTLPVNAMPARLCLAYRLRAYRIDMSPQRFARQSLARSGFPGSAWEPVNES